jgi:LmbE family N-acetylglucosaminyl deacetylase
MVTFDARLPGTAAEVWAADDRFAALPSLSLSGVSELIVFAAHPDDETLGAGGLMSECAARGIPVHVIVVTDGGASHPDSSSISPVHLAVLRRLEVSKATELLAPSATLTFWDFEDGTIRENRERVLAEVLCVVERASENALMVAPWRGDGHRDHRILGEICAEAIEGTGVSMLEYPIWMWHWSSPDADTTPWDTLSAFHLSEKSVVAKRRAIALHRSQVAPLSLDPGDEIILNPLFLRNFDLDIEVFSTGDARPAGASSLAQAYFDSTYERHDDPWGFETRWYEKRKRELTIASLPAERYTNALEIGSSIGVLTDALAARCDQLFSVDVSQAAVDAARIRLRNAPHVSIERADIMDDFPAGSFDLVVLSEVGYYFSPGDLDTLLHRIDDSLTDDGTVVLCHWRHPVADYPLSGDEVHAAIAGVARLKRISHHIEEDFVLDVYSPDRRSVADRTGLLS